MLLTFRVETFFPNKRCQELRPRIDIIVKPSFVLLQDIDVVIQYCGSISDDS